MATLHALGVPQLVLPPQPRPVWGPLRDHGFDGSDAQMVERAARDAPQLLASVYSASCMWAANAASVSPSADTTDCRVHVTPANLSREPHRALETPFTAAALRAALPDRAYFVHHPALSIAGDEGAANQIRLCSEHGTPGLELFVFGQAERGAQGPRLHHARQEEAASRQLASQHRLAPGRALLLQQNPVAIDAGVFHNDVIASGDRSLLVVHEDAFRNGAADLDVIRERFRKACDGELRLIVVERERLSLADAVATYLFNCQMVETASGGTAWIGPRECQEHPGTSRLLEELRADGTFESLHFVDLRESMRNGGGPACLRLRVVLTDSEAEALPSGMRYDEHLHARLAALIDRHYRERLEPADLADPSLIEESRAAVDAATALLGIGSVYQNG